MPTPLALRLGLNARVLGQAPWMADKWTDYTFLILGKDITVRDAKGSSSPPYIANELNNDIYQLKGLENVQPGDVFLDLGTNVGMTAILLAKMFPLARIVGVEPMPFNYAAAMYNINANNVANRIDIAFGALSADGKPLELFYDQFNSGGSTSNSGSSGRGPSFTLQTFSVEELMVLFGVAPERVRFIKLDCEGCEYAVVPSLPTDLRSMFKRAQVGAEIHDPPPWASDEAKARTSELLKRHP